jgi:hypothetical protein
MVADLGAVVNLLEDVGLVEPVDAAAGFLAPPVPGGLLLGVFVFFFVF